MDKELAQLEEWAVNLINDYDSVLKASKAKGEKVSQTEFKRIGRFSGELVANPEAYGELLEMARSKNLTGKQLVQSIRSIEANLLDESSRNTATSRKQMLSDVIHHLFAQRTGGDTLRKLSQAERGEARTILRDSFGRWGNVPENLVSLFRGWHLSGDELKGLEGEALQEFGITKAGQLSTTKAHATAPVSKLITGTHDVSTGREAAQLMAPQFELQRKEGLAAIEESRPLMEALNEIAGSEYNRATMSAEELAVRRNVLSANPEQVKAAIQQYTTPFRFDGGKAILRVLPMGAVATAAFTVADIAQAAQGVSDVSQAQSRAEAIAGGLDATSGILGAVATKVPVLAGPAMVAGATAGAVRMRMQRDIEREQVQQVMAGERSEYGPSVTETPTLTKPMTAYQRRRKARTGRYTAP
jgi:hypothetical protein